MQTFKDVFLGTPTLSAEECREIRKELKLTAAQMAFTLGISVFTINSIETGRHKCKGTIGKCYKMLKFKIITPKAMELL